MSKFIRNESHPYTIVTPDTPLAELAEFLRNNIFALGENYLIFSSAWSTDDHLSDGFQQKVRTCRCDVTGLGGRCITQPL